jgi:hypothetical protein
MPIDHLLLMQAAIEQQNMRKTSTYMTAGGAPTTLVARAVITTADLCRREVGFAA